MQEEKKQKSNSYQGINFSDRMAYNTCCSLEQRHTAERKVEGKTILLKEKNRKNNSVQGITILDKMAYNTRCSREQNNLQERIVLSVEDFYTGSHFSIDWYKKPDDESCGTPCEDKHPHVAHNYGETDYEDGGYWDENCEGDEYSDEDYEDEADEDEATELEICRHIREMISDDSLVDLALEIQSKASFEEELAGSDSAQQSPASLCKRAQRLSGLADQIVEDRKLLITEEGQTFAYQEEGGYFRPVSSPSIYIVSCFPKETRANLLERDVQEIVNRLPWNSRIRCSPDDFNLNPEMVNLENGAFNLETLELLPHDASFRFTYQIHAKYLENESDIDCPVFEHFCATSLEGDPHKRQLLLEFIGYICTDTNNGKCALFLKGQPNSGKSVILSFISKPFDSELVSSIPLHKLGDRFFLAELFGKKLNV